MRVGEALLLNICNTVIAEGDKAVDKLNEAFKEAKITRRLKKARGIGKAGGEIYEKISLLGIEVIKLLEPVEGGNPDWMAIEVILKKLWPTGHAGTRPELLNYVERTSLLWRQWKRVVELMSERDAEVLQSNGGYATFGKECREFCTLYQMMFHEAHCRSFYLHTLIAHAGDFMRELEKHNLTLGMMSNSGAERRHELGRLAFKRSLCGGAWKKRNPKLKDIRNLSVYLAFREISIWQYGMDLLSHHKARCAEEGVDLEIESFRAQIARAKLRPVLPAFSDGMQTVPSETEDAPTGFSSAELAEIEGAMNAASVLEGHTRVPVVGAMRDPESEGASYDPSTDPDLVQDADCCSESDGPGSDDFSDSSESESDADSESDVRVDLNTIFSQDAPMAGDDSDDEDYDGTAVRVGKRPCRRQTRSAVSGQDRLGACGSASGNVCRMIYLCDALQYSDALRGPGPQVYYVRRWAGRQHRITLKLRVEPPSPHPPPLNVPGSRCLQVSGLGHGWAAGGVGPVGRHVHRVQRGVHRQHSQPRAGVSHIRVTPLPPAPPTLPLPLFTPTQGRNEVGCVLSLILILKA
jgi:hypothetical protein